jgi:hypothetical protein
MLIVPFLAILMVAHHSHAFGTQTLPIPMLADFGTTILGPVKTYCENEQDIKGIEIYTILCKSANKLDNEFLKFGKIIMREMDEDELGQNEKGHTVSFIIINTNSSNRGCPNPNTSDKKPALFRLGFGHLSEKY